MQCIVCIVFSSPSENKSFETTFFRLTSFILQVFNFMFMLDNLKENLFQGRQKMTSHP